MREAMVQLKLNPIRSVVEGKRVVMIDDSIVRGTTCAAIVKPAAGPGAKEVHVRVSAPPFVNPCYYGTDIDDPGTSSSPAIIPSRRSPGSSSAWTAWAICLDDW
jgi:glutamine phosphoribosylpyrophosphate amidotransferase